MTFPKRRKEFSAKIKVAAFDRSGGRCEECTARLSTGKFEYDHILPDGLGGEATLENCKVLCSSCHSEKTHAGDRPKMAKADRAKKSYLGISKNPRNAIPGSKSSRFKKKLDGTVEYR